MAAIVTKLTGFAASAALASTALALATPQASPAPAPAPAAAAAAPAGDAARFEKARSLFNDFACGTCHVLKDAGGDGHVGPALDGNANLTLDYVKGRVANGQGAMPGFAGQLSDEEIADVSAYVVAKAAK